MLNVCAIDAKEEDRVFFSWLVPSRLGVRKAEVHDVAFDVMNSALDDILTISSVAAKNEHLPYSDGPPRLPVVLHALPGRLRPQSCPLRG